MKDRIIKYNSFLLNCLVFLTFLGFYVVIMMLVSSGMGELTRRVSIPLRIVIGVVAGLLFLQNYKKKNKFILWFLLFVFVYSFRVFVDYLKSEFFYIPYSDLIFYFLSFCVVPFIAIVKVDFSKIKIESLFNVFLISALVFSLLSVVLYSKFIGVVGRLSSSSAGEDVVNPLIISYCATLVIGVIVFYMMYNKTSKLIKLISFITIALSTAPFFLGSSRGSIFALFFPFLILMFSSLSVRNIFRIILISGIVLIALIYLDSFFDSGLLDRFTGTKEAIETGSSSASRLDIWKYSLDQFIDYPLFGDKLNTNIVNFYPHNIFLEALQSIGFFGFIPFLVLLIYALRYSMYIFKKKPQYAWLTIFFLQALMQNMFSGALYTAAWFWTGMALVLSLYSSIKKEEIKGRIT